MRADISGIGWITAAGAARGADQKPFGLTDGPLPPVTPQSIPGGRYPPFRRMDAYSRLGFGAVALALQDAGLDVWTEKRNIGMIAATAYGCLGADLDYFDSVLSQPAGGPSPSLFSYTLSNIFLADAAIRFGMTGPAFTIHENAPWGVTVLELALESICRGEAGKMLCGVCNPCRPAPFAGAPLVLPGALFFVLESMPDKGASYGKLSLGARGRILFERKMIIDLSQLVRRCLVRGSR